MISINTKACAAILAAVTFGTSCSSTSHHEEYKKRLEASQDAIDDARYWDVNEDMVALLGDVLAEDDPSYDLQGFAAGYQLMRMHELASFSSGYMTEAVVSRTTVDRKNGGKGPSRTGHILASTYFAGKLLTLGPSRSQAVRSFEESNLLPASLEGLTVTRTVDYARLVLSSSYARLGFDSQARDMLFLPEGAFDVFNERDDRADIQVAEMLADHDLIDASQAWVYFTVYRRCRESPDHRGLAYRFGVRAIHSARAAKEGKPPLRGKAAQWAAQLEVDFHDWIRALDEDQENGGVFMAEDGTAYKANVLRSGEDQDVIEFRFRAHKSGSGF